MAIITIPFRFPGISSVCCAFQTRAGGSSLGDCADGNISFDVGDDPARVLANRTTLRDGLGFSHWIELKQVHGPVMHFDLFGDTTGDIEAPGTIEGDGLGTSLPGHALVMKTADCQPILVAHASGRYIAALHAGWRGNRIGFPVTGVREFCDHYGIDPRDCHAVRGPSLGPAKAEFTDFSIWDSGFLPYYDIKRQAMDLWRCTRDQLHAAGIPREHIYGIDLCTLENSDTFFSYRKCPSCGRQASLIWIDA